MSPGFSVRWGLRHPVRSVREAYLWQRRELGYGVVMSVITTPWSWLAMTGLGR